MKNAACLLLTVAFIILESREVFQLSPSASLWNSVWKPRVVYAHAEAQKALVSCHGSKYWKELEPELTCSRNGILEPGENNNTLRCSDARLLILLGKGPTARPITRGMFPNSVLVGLNEGVALVEDPDYLVCDYRAVLANYKTGQSRLKSDIISKINNIIVPKHHYDMTYTIFLQFLQERGFRGQVHLYNNPKTQKNKLDGYLPTLTGYRSSGEVALKYLLLHDKNRLNVSGVLTFGVSRGPVGHPYSTHFLAGKHAKKTYLSTDKLVRVYENILSILEKASLPYMLC